MQGEETGRQNEDKSEVNVVKQIPDFDTELDQSINFIFESEITKKALIAPPFNNFTNILLEIIHSIDRLADNCHMAEFTNDAMPHICSIIKRASECGFLCRHRRGTSISESGHRSISGAGGRKVYSS